MHSCCYNKNKSTAPKKGDNIMPRGKRTPRVYTGKAAKLNEKILQMEAQLKDLKAERDAAYKEQIRADKKNSRIRKTDAEKQLIETIRKYGEDPAKLLEDIKRKNGEDVDQSVENQEDIVDGEASAESDIIE